MTDRQELVARKLLVAGAIKDKTRSPEGQGFRLKLHEEDPDAPLSPVYIDLRVLPSFPDLLADVADVYCDVIENQMGDTPDLIAGIPVAAIPIATLVSQNLDIPLIIPRVDVKTHGSGARVDGVFEPGQTALLLDDLVTGFHSKEEAATILREASLQVSNLAVLVDREQGGAEGAEKAQIRLHSVFTLRQLFRFYRTCGLMTADTYGEVMAYLGQ